MYKNLYRRAVALAAVSSLALTAVRADEGRTIDLQGRWAFQLDLMDFRRNGSLDFRYEAPLQDSITLPAITDDYQLGMKSTYSHTDRLTREYEYMGPAWYQRTVEIPADWKGKRIILSLERCHWLTTVYVGKTEAGQRDYISVPHRYDLTDLLTPGKSSSLMVCVDNRWRYGTHKWNHAHTEFSQINWNGILGQMTLKAVDPVSISDMQIYPDIKGRSIKIKTRIGNYSGAAASGDIKFDITGDGYAKSVTLPFEAGADTLSTVEHTVELGNDIKLWNEFTPNLYTATATLTSGDNSSTDSVTFGMREVSQGKNQVMVNGEPVHLRGTVENAVFPLTGYAPVDDASWERIFRILKSYGMNHMRFHSWCPPEAAFRAADKLGVYLQVELPFWGADAQPDQARFDFFRREQRAILEEYGNHPSFLLYCNGNEISGDFGFVEELTHAGRNSDSRHLYSGSTARERVPSDQFYNSHRTPKGSITVYEGNPSTMPDRSRESDIDVPVIAHEAGQRCMYPDFKEIAKYTGPVKARNMELFRNQLDENGMLDQAEDFFRASGMLTVIEYKDVIETLLRTPTSGGFQMLSINDLPEQGHSFVGILDPMWNSKGLIEADEFRRFCAPVVPLLRFEKRAWTAGERFEARAQIYNYGPTAIRRAAPTWSVTDDNGKKIAGGRLTRGDIAKGGIAEIGSFGFELPAGDNPQRLTVTLDLDKETSNSWNIWVYPQDGPIMQSDDQVLYTAVLDDTAKARLAAGGKVVLCPKPTKVEGRKSVFHNHFWNPIMFKWAPMTLGCLIDSDNPVFDDFPTDYHTDWQWWDILTNAKVIEMQDMPSELRPFIQVIDSYDSNRKLGIGFEAAVGGGKLLVLAVDTARKMDERPATRQLLRSIDRYVRSDAFAPAVELDAAQIESFLKR